MAAGPPRGRPAAQEGFERRARAHVPDNERKLRDDLTKATDRIKELIAELNKLRGENHALARIINVRELENHQLRTGTDRRAIWSLCPRTRTLKPSP